MIAALLGSRLAEYYELEAVSTSTGRRGVRRYTAFPFAIVHLLWIFTFRTPAGVHVHTASWNSFPRKRVVVAVARAFRIPVILQVHGGGFLEYIGEGPTRACAVRRTLARCSAVIILTEAMREPLEAMTPGGKVWVVPNAVELPSLPTHGMDGGRVVFAGRPVEEKGIPELLQASRTIAPRVPSFRLVIAGDDVDGALADEVQNAGLEASVELRGWLDHEALDRLYAESSVFVLPSQVEAMPVALLEAMSHGLACVVTPVGAIPQVVADGMNGLVIPVGDVGALEGALMRLLSEPRLRQRLGNAARATIEERYSMISVALQIREVYTACGITPLNAVTTV
jgi:glycosyltransferase involved in cell wall biosynthesis